MVGETLLWVAGAALILLFPFCIVSIRSFDQLVHRLHQQSNKDWRALGQPCGYFWFPREGRVAGRSWSSLSWLFFTPDCIRKDFESHRLLRRRRVSFWVWNLGFLGVVGLYAAFVLLNAGL